MKMVAKDHALPLMVRSNFKHTEHTFYRIKYESQLEKNFDC